MLRTERWEAAAEARANFPRRPASRRTGGAHALRSLRGDGGWRGSSRTCHASLPPTIALVAASHSSVADPSSPSFSIGARFTSRRRVPSSDQVALSRTERLRLALSRVRRACEQPINRNRSDTVEIRYVRINQPDDDNFPTSTDTDDCYVESLPRTKINPYINRDTITRHFLPRQRERERER